MKKHSRTPLSWQTLSNKEIQPRCAHGAILVQNHLFISSGFFCEAGPNFELKSLYDFQCFDIISKRFVPIPSNRDVGRDHFSSCYYNGSWYMFGGLFHVTTAEFVSEDLYVCTMNKKLEWKRLEPTGIHPDARMKHSAVVLNDGMLVYGGINDMDNVQFDDLWEFDFKTKKWCEWPCTIEENGREVTILGRALHSAAVIDQTMYIFGGKSGITNERFNTMFSYQDHKWSLIQPRGDIPAKRAGASMSAHRQILYIFGGFTGKFDTNDLYSFDTRFQLWSKIQFETMPNPSSFHTCCVYEDRNPCLILCGGLYQRFENEPEDSFLYDDEETIFCSDIVSVPLMSENFWINLKQSIGFQFSDVFIVMEK